MSAMLSSSGISAGIEGKVIAITEAGSGIGAAAAELLAARGAHVMLGGRWPEQVAARAATLARCGGSVRHQVVDVT
ncbi:MAG TPA: SDR family NAD(P)-dependent oxidoreductase, partial [Roseateles sp.]|nr:SDR family NAD(P)-dependent oxidoreductase [Roseateles sp.]